MVTVRIEVLIDPRQAAAGAREVREGIEKTESAASRLRREAREAFNALGKTAKAASGLAADAARAAEEQAAAIERTNSSVREAIASIEEENRLLGLNVEERRVQARVLQQVGQIEGQVTQEQRAGIESSIRANEELQTRAAVLDRIRGPQQRFQQDLVQLRHLLSSGAITQREFNAELARMRSRLKETETAADRTRLVLSRLFAGVTAAFVVREIGQIADTYTTLQNRIRVVTEDEQELADVTEQLFNIANDTASAFDATVEVYSRTALALKDLGIQQERTLQFTKSLNQAVLLSGASSEEARAGLIQLSQGLASGALRGDELRSVLEQLPVVSDVIARSLGITRGELRELGAEGKITTEIILRAFEEAEQELETGFQNRVLTLGESFTILRNNVTRAVGEINEATGVTNAFGASLRFVAENLDIAAAATFTLVVGALAATGGLTKLAAAARLVITFLATNPYVLATAAIAATAIATERLVRGFLDVRQQIKDLRVDSRGLARDAFSPFENVRIDIVRVREEIARLNSEPVTFANAEELGGLNLQLKALLAEQERLQRSSASTREARAQENKDLQELRKRRDEVIEGLKEESRLLRLGAREREIEAEALRAIAQIESKGGELAPEDEERIRRLIRQNRALEERGDALERIQGPQRAFEQQLRILNDLQAAGLITEEQLKNETVKLAEAYEGLDLSNQSEQFRSLFEEAQKTGRELALQAQLIEELRGPEEALIERKRVLTSLLGDERVNQERLRQAIEATNFELENLGAQQGPDQLKQRIAQLHEQFERGFISEQKYIDELQRIERTRGPSAEFLAGLAKLREELDKGTLSADEFLDKLEKLARAQEQSDFSIKGGFDRGLQTIEDRLKNVGGAIEDSLVRNFMLAEDALVSFVRTGELDLDRLFDSILDDLARIAVQQALLGFSSGIGALFGGPKARGGDVNPNQAFLVGEEGPELFSPPGAGRITDADRTSRLMQSAPVVVPPPQIQINNIENPDRTFDDLDSPRGERMVMNIFRRNRREMREVQHL